MTETATTNGTSGDPIGDCTLCPATGVELVASNPGSYDGSARICAACVEKMPAPGVEFKPRPARRKSASDEKSEGAPAHGADAAPGSDLLEAIQPLVIALRTTVARVARALADRLAPPAR